ncbi:MAG: nitroreductase [Oscillospiraceae bacterium]|nr:nitroreductase [Oscillospiraceae bacterium]
MNEIIRKRKSVRKYDMTPLDSAALEKVQKQIEELKPLYSNIKYSVQIANKTKGVFNVKAPHYLIFCSEEREGHLENIGFFGQQMDLFFSASGLGSCWLGASKPEQKEDTALPHIICMAFGKAAEPLHRELSEFKRKPLSDISEGDDERIEAARLAPSAVNTQNWHFIAENNKIHCYQKKPNPLLVFMFNKLNCIDMGIALCHIAEESESFSFKKIENPPARKCCVYLGSVL